MTAHALVLYALAVLTGTVAIARAVRLVVADDWPPIAWVRGRWEYATAARDLDGGRMRYDRGPQTGELVPGPWTKLLTCPFCFAPYAAAVDLTWAVLARHSLLTGHGPWGVAWWLLNGWAAVSYATAMLVVRDEPVD